MKITKLNKIIINQLKQQINNERNFSFPKLKVLPTLSCIILNRFSVAVCIENGGNCRKFYLA